MRGEDIFVLLFFKSDPWKLDKKYKFIASIEQDALLGSDIQSKKTTKFNQLEDGIFL